MKKIRIEKKLRRKTNPDLVSTIIAGKKNSKWLEVANKTSSPKRKKIVLNLDEINQQSKENDIIVIPGKVLGVGNVNKKIKIVAFSFSSSAMEKLKKAKIETSAIIDEIKKNPDAKNVKILDNGK